MAMLNCSITSRRPTIFNTLLLDLPQTLDQAMKCDDARAYSVQTKSTNPPILLDARGSKPGGEQLSRKISSAGGGIAFHPEKKMFCDSLTLWSSNMVYWKIPPSSYLVH